MVLQVLSCLTFSLITRVLNTGRPEFWLQTAGTNHSCAHMAYRGINCNVTQTQRLRNTNGNFLTCSNQHRDSCPDGEESNRSELDHTSDRTVMAARGFTGGAAARQVAPGDWWRLSGITVEVMKLSFFLLLVIMCLGSLDSDWFSLFKQLMCCRPVLSKRIISSFTKGLNVITGSSNRY